jgi:hypothetical protein
MLTETTPTQDRLAEIFDLGRWTPHTQVIHPTNINNAMTSRNAVMIELARKLPLAQTTGGDKQTPHDERDHPHPKRTRTWLVPLGKLATERSSPSPTCSPAVPGARR